MKKKIGWILGIILIVAVGYGWHTYKKFDAKMIRLTPEFIKELNKQSAAQNEAAIKKPEFRERTLQPQNPLKNVYFGDLHVHTSLSLDAYMCGNTNYTPDQAYEFAQGKKLEHVSGEILQLSEPLDFVAITDHAESFGIFDGCKAPGLTEKQKEFCAKLDSPSLAYYYKLRKNVLERPPKRPADYCGEDDSFCIEHGKTTWKRIQKAADKAYKPGEFTSFYGYEYSPLWPKAGMTHRNVIFRNKTVPETVISAFDAMTALDLWKILEDTCTGDCEFLTIPHNMSNFFGRAYSRNDEDGAPYTPKDWERRDRYEPLAEIFQAKRTSECAFGVGTTDEECSFELFWPICEDDNLVGCASKGSYAREGLKLGIELEK
ncbi:MAG: DUF3604 domain-containing protein, partial [Desulfobacula sp.]|uniref:DUF3604 domain-containing protein n=1 Tax=Desulfobacula sp. TaxID=2593537 RepID=UPI0025BBCFA4